MLGSLAKQSTTQQTRWFAASNPDYTKPGPWNTALFVGDKHSSRPFLKITISDHGNTLTAAWISEELLQPHCLVGRIAASDVIIDVEKHHVIYHELGNYGQLVSCNESK